MTPNASVHRYRPRWPPELGGGVHLSRSGMSEKLPYSDSMAFSKRLSRVAADGSVVYVALLLIVVAVVVVAIIAGFMHLILAVRAAGKSMGPLNRLGSPFWHIHERENIEIILTRQNKIALDVCL